MYEPIRTKSVHTMAAPEPDLPHRSREEELQIRLAGHLTALLTVTDELRALAPDSGLDDAAQRLTDQVARLRDGHAPFRAAPSVTSADPTRIAALHQRAHTLAGWALVVATSREDAAGADLAAERLAAHATALGLAA
ncbi:hypothetical protein AB0B12_03585 [Streptomyces sp. NPDC044780]|uniref:Uncharacterized protein n=1 Tax=Streptomyces luomodiensis TaxID=3026192 RepID=A0ABY9V1D1_9ACTN|nr:MULTISPECIES: hypothetical protein [unclassified Streptomyces]WAP58007.1 hypothetical protein N6H00_25310 [Streptomyces sp. S465]WNE98558.1 hypothetical protein PS467_26125 [Streptomyces sp. SCA4-21]